MGAAGEHKCCIKSCNDFAAAREHTYLRASVLVCIYVRIFVDVCVCLCELRKGNAGMLELIRGVPNV